MPTHLLFHSVTLAGGLAIPTPASSFLAPERLCGYTDRMTSDAVIAILRAHEAPLRRQGVRRAALFGSTARGEATADSDLDILVDIDPSAQVDLYDYVGIAQYIAALFAVPVDVADQAMLIDPVRRTAERDAVYAF